MAHGAAGIGVLSARKNRNPRSIPLGPNMTRAHGALRCRSVRERTPGCADARTNIGYWVAVARTMRPLAAFVGR
jgi:hypothetical protein